MGGWGRYMYMLHLIIIFLINSLSTDIVLKVSYYSSSVWAKQACVSDHEEDEKKSYMYFCILFHPVVFWFIQIHLWLNHGCKIWTFIL